MDDEGFIFQADLGPIPDHPVLSFRPFFFAILLLQNEFEEVIVFDLFRHQRFHLSIRHLNCWCVLYLVAFPTEEHASSARIAIKPTARSAKKCFSSQSVLLSALIL